MQKIIGVDVDCCVVDMLTPWFNWFETQNRHLGLRRPQFDQYTYRLDPVMDKMVHDIENHNSWSSFSYWQKRNLYDDLVPVKGAEFWLKQLHDRGFKIVFVSLCVPEHEESKRNFLKKHFPYAAGFISTGDKQYTKYDIFIDDSAENINKCQRENPNRTHILFDMVPKAVMGVGPVVSIPVTGHIPMQFDNWRSVANFIYPNIIREVDDDILFVA